MVAIPSAEAAREAWDALPQDVRASVIERAVKSEGHRDPAIAAIAVGRARAEEWPWWRTAMFGVGMCLFAGAGLAVVMITPSVVEPSAREWVAVIVPGLAGCLLFDGAPRLRTGARLPRATEIANLRVFLASPDAEVSPPTASHSALTPRRIATAAATAAGMVAVALGAVQVSGAPSGIFGMEPDGVSILIGFAVLMAVFAYQFRRHPIRARAAEDGLRFNWRRKPIPWRDVTGVSLKRSNVVWSLRDGTTVEMIVAGLGRQPENVYLPARAYMEAAKQAA
jgi:hypothetical protein